MGKWVLLAADGSVAAQVHTRRGRTPREDGSNPDELREVEVNRFGEVHERFVKGRWIVDPERAAELVDVDHRQARGPHAIAIAHAVKAIEARLLLAGVAIDGLLAAEARATGQDLHELAQAVIAAANAADQYEIDRIAAKRAARNQRRK